MFVDQPLEAFLDRVELHIEVLNRALINIPPDQSGFMFVGETGKVRT